MTLLFHIVYAAHARGTHHKLALDALRHLDCMDADLWRRLFLKHAGLYLDGSKAPDDEFKDFKNHVLHTRDGYWGGAPEKARSWYNHLVEALAVQDWETAVYCAGVLSHYYTDPLHPFHTAQSEAENNIHRACEWSISKSYDDLRTLGEMEFPAVDVDLPSDPNWLPQLVCRGAEKANAHYEKLIAHYDFTRGVVDPPSGLDRVAKRIVAELIRYAYVSFAAVLSRAIAEANVHAPDVSLTPAMLLATVQIPVKVLTKRMADAEERRTVERIYDELAATGTVEHNLPEDDRAVRAMHQREVLAKLAPPPQVSKVFPFKPRERVLTRVDQRRAERGESEALETANVIPLRAPRPVEPSRPAAEETVPVFVPAARIAAAQPAPPLQLVASDGEGENEADGRSTARGRVGLTDRLDKVLAPIEPLAPKAAPRPDPEPEADLEAEIDTDAETEAEVALPPAAVAASSERHFHLSLDNDVVDGPSIGPKTAERLYPHGVKTVRDLLKADPAALAVLINARHIGAETISGWQDQARLVCTVPGLRGTHAQLLVGAGYRSAGAIADAEPDKLCADVLAFAATAPGMRLLRNGDPPDIEKIKGWLEAARSMKAA